MDDIISIYVPGRNNSRTIGYVTRVETTKKGDVIGFAISPHKSFAVHITDEAHRQKVVRSLQERFGLYGA